jgi:SAM-dependent methyltransferase
VSTQAGDGHWFEPIAEHLGKAYLRYSFTKGTVQEVDAIVEWLGLVPGERVLDVGCGPGRHSLELARRGIETVGIDISERFVTIARESAPGICLCQGAFGLMTADGDDVTVLAGIARALKPGGRLALSAFSAYYSVRYHGDAVFDADTGVSHERTEVRDEEGRPEEVDLWTGCYTPRELRLLASATGLRADRILSVDPGAYRPSAPTLESSEYLLIASKPPFRR